MSDVHLTYVGKKPSAIDSIGGTGVIWNGHGDVQPVPEAVAEKLLKHPDQWQRAVVKAKASTEGSKKDGKSKKENAPPATPEENAPPVPDVDPGFAA